MCFPDVLPTRPPDAATPSRRTVLTGAGGLAGLAGLAVTGCGAAAPDPRFAIRDVAVFDGERSRGPSTVLVDGARIAAVGADVVVPPEVPVVDGRGRTLLPGLIDSHVHAFGPDTDAPRFGVTTEVDMFTFTEMLGPYRERRASTAPSPAADLWSAGILATAPGGHGTQYGPVPTLPPAAGEREAADFVARRLDAGSDFLKIIVDDGGLYGAPLPTLDDAAVGHLVTASRRRGTTSVAHVGGRRDAAAALAAGPDGLAHVAGEPMPADLVARAAAQQTFVVATLVVYDYLACAGGARSLVDDPRLGPRLTSEQRGALGAAPRRCRPPLLGDAVANVAALHAAGVAVLAGTDAAGPRLAHGASLHGELELLTRAGLTPSDALRAATAEPARRFGLDRRGRIAPEHRADLVLVRGDPTRDITATRDVERVWHNGAPVAA